MVIRGRVLPGRRIGFAVLALLRRRLSDDEIDQVVALSVEHAHETPDRHIDYSHVRELIAGTIGEEPSEEDIERVTRRLGEGWRWRRGLATWRVGVTKMAMVQSIPLPTGRVRSSCAAGYSP